MLIIFNWILDNRNPSQFSEGELDVFSSQILPGFENPQRANVVIATALGDRATCKKTIIVHRELLTSSCNIYLGFCQIKKRTGNTENHGQVLPVFNAPLFCILKQDCKPDMS